MVAELEAETEIKILDRSELSLGLGRDVFTDGFISSATQQQCIAILLRFSEQLAGWGISPRETSVIATSAFREAKNRDPVTDRINARTGFTVRIIDGIEENRLMYLAVTECLKNVEKKLRKEDSMIVEVGGGSSEMMLISKGKIAGAHSLAIGAVRIEQQLRSLASSVSDIQRYIEEFLRNTKGAIESELNLSAVKQFIAVGGDASIAATTIGKPVSPWLWHIDRTAFDKFVAEVQQYSVEERTARFKISYNEAQTLHVSLLIYWIFIHLTKAKTILVAQTNIRYGLLISETTKHGDTLQKEFDSQVTASALSLLHKYHSDERHAEYVRQTSLQLFDLLSKEIAFGERSRLLLEVAAILHDIGNFIRVEKHNLHSEYIIKNSEIFGISKSEKTIVAEIAKYHRGAALPQDDEYFVMLPRVDRMTILKLTSILRVADALDRGHLQGMTNLEMSLQKDTLLLQTSQQGTALEKMALAEKADMFETVFGYKLIFE